MSSQTEPIRIELPTVFGMKTVNSYLIKNESPTLIDCGENTEASWMALKAGLAKEGLSIGDIERVIITHAHVDHIGMASRIAEHSKAVIWVNERSVDWAVHVREQWTHRTVIMQKLIGKFFKPAYISTMAESLRTLGEKMVDVWLPINREDLEVYPIEGQLNIGGTDYHIMYLPGHSNTQTCFFNESNGHFISADMLLNITPTPVLEEDADRPGKREAGLLKMLRSYDRITELNISQVFPGHYTPFNQANMVIKRQVKRIRERSQECLEHISHGQSDILSIYQTMYGKQFSLPAFNMLIGYLDLLKHNGQITYLPADGYHRIVSTD